MSEKFEKQKRLAKVVVEAACGVVDEGDLSHNPTAAKAERWRRKQVLHLAVELLRKHEGMLHPGDRIAPLAEPRRR